MIRIQAIEPLRAIYQKNPRLYTLGELCIVLGCIFLILWVLRFYYWGVYLTALTGFVCICVLLSSFLVHQDTLKELGIRVDNLSQSLKEASIATVLCIGLIVCIFMLSGVGFRHHNPHKVIKSFLTYILWGTVQQFGLNSFLYLRFKKVVTNNSVAIIIAAGLFSLIHTPNMGLVIFTSVGGLIFCYLFSRNRNIFSLGIMHGTVATLAFLLLIPGYLKYPTVGPAGTEIYSAYGKSLLICSGDVNGDGKDEILISKGPAEESDSEILVLTGDGGIVGRFTAFDAQSRYGVNLAAGDVNGDGVDEIIAAKGPWRKNDTLITVLTGSGEETVRFVAFPRKKYGANVAAGDVNGDGVDEIIVGLGPGQGYRPIIRIFTGEGKLLLECAANDYIQRKEYYQEMRHGVCIAAGDVDGDGADEIVAGPPHLRPFRNYFMTIDFDGGFTAPKRSRWFCVYLQKYPHYGISLATGDVNGDGIDEIIAGPGPDYRAVADLMVLDKSGALLFETVPFDTHYGLTVATADTDGNGVPEILATPGIGEKRAVGVVKVLDLVGVKRELDLRRYFE